jgi:exosortase
MATPSQNRIALAGAHPASVGANWRPAIWFILLFLASYAVVLSRLAKLWLTDSDMSHGMFVPILACYIAWRKREELAAVKPTHNLFGLLLMIVAGALLCVGPPSLDTYASVTRISFMMSLIGMLLFLLGFEAIRILIYPLVLMLLMMPMPGFILQQITFPLQIVATKLAEAMLELIGFSVLRDGNVLILPGQTLNVAEACSGLRSLMGLTFLGQAYVYLFDSRPWMRGVIALVVIPIGVFANSVRIVATAIAGSHNREWAQGLFHESTGWVVFVVAFLGILGTHSLLKRIWPDRGIA